MGTCSACTLSSLTCILNVHFENPKFDRGKGHVRDLSSTRRHSWPKVYMCKISAFYVDLSMSYRESRRTDGRTDIQDDPIKHCCGILNNLLPQVVPVVGRKWFYILLTCDVDHFLPLRILSNWPTTYFNLPYKYIVYCIDFGIFVFPVTSIHCITRF